MPEGFTLYVADCVGNKTNALYPHKVVIDSVEKLQKAVKRDYVGAEYKNYHRGKDAFVQSNCVVLDVDNNETEDESEWLYPENITESFPDVPIGIHYSRHHMKQKEQYGPRPRFHVMFACEMVTSDKEYAALKARIMKAKPRFDRGAMDAARLFYGTPEGKCEFHPGKITINECLEMYYESDVLEDAHAVIPQGQRNSALSHFAGCILKRLGTTEEAHARFLQRAEDCDPPLEDAELNTIWRSALAFYDKVSKQPGYIPPKEYDASPEPDGTFWELPLALEEEALPPFPMDALPPVLKNYAEAVAESTQTAPDMSAVGILCAVSAAMRNLYVVEGKKDWHEPTNIYGLIVAEPSERKSAVIRLITKPIDDFVRDYNLRHKVEIEMSKAQKQKLENRKNALISAAKKKNSEETDDGEELQSVIRQIAMFEEKKPLRVYVDDTTPEKLVETLADNNNTISIISSEGGIFDVLSGAYSSKVNIDVFLKAYSGERISVDRIMRNSVVVDDACLTILLTVQPVVIADLMKNEKFRHRGLTARFLYTQPKSLVGERDFHSESISSSAYERYRELISNILMEERGGNAKAILLDKKATAMLQEFYDWTEKKLVDEFSVYGDWIGKLVGNTLRIAGILARANVLLKNVGDELLQDDEDIIVKEDMMYNAIRIGKYFFAHAVRAYSAMGIYCDFRSIRKVVERVRERALHGLTRRKLMRNCRWIASAEEAQHVLDTLEDYGYVRITKVDVSDKLRGGRPQNPVYAVHPSVFE